MYGIPPNIPNGIPPKPPPPNMREEEGDLRMDEARRRMFVFFQSGPASVSR
jgi:hypothetical protein